MGGISTLGQSLSQIGRINDLQVQLSTLERQLASQKKASLFDELGTGVLLTQRARADFSSLDTYITNTKTADRRIDLMNLAIDEIRVQSEGLQSALQVQTQEGELELESIGSYAANLREFMFDLLNQQDGDRYLFAGSDTGNQPITDTGTLDTFLDNQIDNWINGVIDTDTLINNFTDDTVLNDSIVGFSSALSSGNTKDVTVRVDEGIEVDYTVRANEEAFRNVIIGVALFDRLNLALDGINSSPDDPPGFVTAPGATVEEQNANFYQIFDTVTNFLNSALDDIDDSQFKLSAAQAQIQSIRESHVVEKGILADQISDVEDIDLNEIAVQISSLQIQLEASYSVTAAIRDLSLVNYL